MNKDTIASIDWKFYGIYIIQILKKIIHHGVTQDKVIKNWTILSFYIFHIIIHLSILITFMWFFLENYREIIVSFSELNNYSIIMIIIVVHLSINIALLLYGIRKIYGHYFYETSIDNKRTGNSPNTSLKIGSNSAGVIILYIGLMILVSMVLNGKLDTGNMGLLGAGFLIMLFYFPISFISAISDISYIKKRYIEVTLSEYTKIKTDYEQAIENNYEQWKKEMKDILYK